MLVSRSARAICPRIRIWIAATLAFAFTFEVPVSGQGIAAIQNITSRPFVTGITPIIGSRGGVGGVLVDAKGVVSRVEQAELDELRGSWKPAVAAIDGEVNFDTDFRVVSLAGLDRALAKRLDDQQPLTPEMILLAGLRRVEYVVADPENHDVLLAGPGGPWKANQAGEVVGVKDGRPVLRLDDLMDALRTARQSSETEISCSIEPTAEGLQRYARVRARLRSFNPLAIRSMEKAIGPQQVFISGIESDSHFARVMLSADYVMKRLAMGFEESPVDGMPSYLELLKRHSTGFQLSSPRWWLAADYESMRCTPDRLVWQIRGQGVRAMTEDSRLTADGARKTLENENKWAQQWADTMTDQFDPLSSALPIFGELRNCFDLAVVGALMASEGLDVRSDCQLSVLTDESRLQGPRLQVPKSIPSIASSMQGRRGWIVSVSGGVKIDAWSVIENVDVSDSLKQIRSRTVKPSETRWWW